jgi:hypothetical protein
MMAMTMTATMAPMIPLGISVSPDLERFQAKWTPVRVKKTRQKKNPEPGSDAIRTERLWVMRIHAGH